MHPPGGDVAIPYAPPSWRSPDKGAETQQEGSRRGQTPSRRTMFSSVAAEETGVRPPAAPRPSAREKECKERQEGELEEGGGVGAAGFEPALSRSTVWRPTELDEAPGAARNR